MLGSRSMRVSDLRIHAVEKRRDLCCLAGLRMGALGRVSQSGVMAKHGGYAEMAAEGSLLMDASKKFDFSSGKNMAE